MRNVRRLLAVVFAMMLMPGGIWANDSSDSSSAPKNPDYKLAKKAVKAGRYDEAVPLLQKVIAGEPGNADAHNYLGYSYRKLGNRNDALAHYQKALEINPKHRGANEYLGELYLEEGDLAAAETRLEALDNACFFTCEEYRDLKKLIKKYKAKNSG